MLTDGDPEYGHGYIHGIYDLGGTTSIGLFTGHEDWDGDRWVTTGLEFRTAFGEGSTGGVAIEGFVAQTEFDGDIDDMFGAKVIWSATPMIDVYGSYATSSGVDDLQNVGIGAVYSHSSGAYGRIGIDNLSGDSDRDSFTVEIGFKVNDGATFATRSWNDIFPGY